MQEKLRRALRLAISMSKNRQMTKSYASLSLIAILICNLSAQFAKYSNEFLNIGAGRVAWPWVMPRLLL